MSVLQAVPEYQLADLTTKVMMVTPQLAQQWLNDHNFGNRKLRTSRVDIYAQAMRRGEWMLTGEAIIFDEKGRLANGQNRLTAVVQANVSAPFLVVWGSPEEAFHQMDSGLSRSLSDVAPPWARQPSTTAFANVMLYGYMGLADGGKRQEVTRAQKLAFIVNYREPIEFTRSIFARRKVNLTQAPIVGAFGRAYYHLDHDLLRREAEVLVGGISHGVEDEPIILLRNWLYDVAADGRSASRLGAYAKAERALLASQKRERVAKLYMASNELFSLPEEVITQEA